MTTPIHVLHAAKLFPPPFGGIETVLDRLTTGLCEFDRTIKLDILATHPEAPSHLEFADGRLQVNQIRSIAQFARTPIAPAYRSVLKESQADLLHFHFPYPWAELSFLTSGVKKPYIVSYHADIVKQKYLLKIWNPFMHRFLAGANKVVVASPHIIKDSPILQKLPSDKIIVIPYGIDTEFFRPTTESRAAAQALRTQLAGPRPLLFFLGRLVYYKGVDVLIEAMQNLDAHLIIGGDGPLRRELERATQEAGLSSKVTFAGNISPKELPLYYQAADLFVLPSTDTSEAFGMVMLEAHASGIPVISTNLPTGVVFVNQHEKTGFCVTTGDPQALVNGIQSLISNQGLRQSMGIFAQRRASLEFDTLIMCERYHQLYQEVLAESSLSIARN
jgi:rhamnosyl/mannosyltransferase